jgi:hypothetical protein
MKRLVILVCVICLACPLLFAGKNKQVEPKVLPEVRPDKALVYLCLAAKGNVGTTSRFSFLAFVDKRLFGARIDKKSCTYDYVDPGPHDIWYFKAQMVNPFAVSVLRWDFEQGRTYYMSLRYDSGLSHFELLDADAGKGLVDAALGISSEANPKDEYWLKRALKKPEQCDLDTANNALIASSTLDRAIAAADTADASGNEDALRFQEEAAVLFAEAADRFGELRRIAAKNRKLAILNNIIGPALAEASVRAQAKTNLTGSGLAFYGVYNVKSYSELVDAYDELEAAARADAFEARRRLACYADSREDAVIDRCIGGE